MYFCSISLWAAVRDKTISFQQHRFDWPPMLEFETGFWDAHKYRRHALSFRIVGSLRKPFWRGLVFEPHTNHFGSLCSLSQSSGHWCGWLENWWSTAPCIRRPRRLGRKVKGGKRHTTATTAATMFVFHKDIFQYGELHIPSSTSLIGPLDWFAENACSEAVGNYWLQHHRHH